MPNPNDPFNVEWLREMLGRQRWPSTEYYRPAQFMTPEECEQRSTMPFTDADAIIAHGLGVDLTR